MPLTPGQHAAIRARVTDWKPDDAAICADLNAATEPNPVTEAPKIPVPFSPATLWQGLSPASLHAIAGSGIFSDLRADLLTGKREAVVSWVQFGAAAQLITSDEADALLTQLAATEPDPAWSKEVSWSAINLGRAAEVADVAEVRAQVVYEEVQAPLNAAKREHDFAIAAWIAKGSPGESKDDPGIAAALKKIKEARAAIDAAVKP